MKYQKPKMGFMDLPAELRVEIYRHTLLPGHNHNPRRTNYRRRKSPHRLLQVSKAVKVEAAPLLYGTSFSFNRTKDAHRFLLQIGEENASHIKSLYIDRYREKFGRSLRRPRFQTSFLIEFATLLAKYCPGLVELKLGNLPVVEDDWGLKELRELQHLSAVMPWLTARCHSVMIGMVSYSVPGRAPPWHLDEYEFNIPLEIERKETIMYATRSAGGRKAAATRQRNVEEAKARAEAEKAQAEANAA